MLNYIISKGVKMELGSLIIGVVIFIVVLLFKTDKKESGIGIRLLKL